MDQEPIPRNELIELFKFGAQVMRREYANILMNGSPDAAQDYQTQLRLLLSFQGQNFCSKTLI